MLLHLALILSALCANPNVNQPQNTFHHQVSSFINHTIEAHKMAGVSVSIVRDKKIAFTGAFGVTSTLSQEPLNQQHLFHLASISKTFVATAVMQLAAQGKLDLDATLVSYLPDMAFTDRRFGAITIRQMLNHTSGLPDVEDYEWDRPQKDEDSAARYVRSLTNIQLLDKPGAAYEYSNIAYDILGVVIAKVSQMSFEDYMRENIFKPLHMPSSTFFKPEIAASKLVEPHEWDLGPKPAAFYPYNRIHAPSSTLHSNAEEMAHWAIANLNRGTFKGHRFLPASDYQQLWRKTLSKVEGRYDIGLTWFLDHHRGHSLVMHDGADTGFVAFLALFPKEGAAVFMASNYSTGPLLDLYRGLLDFALGYQPVLPKSSIAWPFCVVYESDGIVKARDWYAKAKKEERSYRTGPSELRRLGSIYLRRNMYPAAEEVLKFNAYLFDKDAETHFLLAKIHLVQKNMQKAYFHLGRTLVIAPNHEEAASLACQMAEAR